MLLNKLYKVISLTENPDGSGFHAEIELYPDHDVFGGHFPGNPILPGVCTVQIIKELLEQSVQKSLRLTKAGNIKYLGFVNPVNMPVLTFQLQLRSADSTCISCSTIVIAAGATVCSFKGEFIPSMSFSR